MSSVDNRVIEMQFKHEQFQANVQDTVKSLEGLKEGLNLSGATKALQGLQTTGDNFKLSGIAAGVQQLTDRFSTMGIVGMTVINNMTNAAIDMGKKVGGALLGPMVEGGKKRALSIAQAKFQFEGLGMDIEATMKNANDAVSGTSYGLADAAMVASQFGASGMRAGDAMYSSLRAVSGVAAMTGREYSDIGRIFVGVAGNGRLMGNDLLQLSSSGVNAAATLAKSLGKTEAEVREMVSDGKISFKVFSDAMDDAFGAHAKDANKLFVGALANVKSALGRIGADVAAVAFDNLRDILNALRPVINNVHTALKPLIGVFNDFSTKVSKGIISNLDATGIAPLVPMLQAVHNVFKGLYGIIVPIKEAFREIFPPATTAQLLAFATGLNELTAKFKMGSEQTVNIRNTFKGMFAVLDAGIYILVSIGKALLSMVGPLLPIADALLRVTANIGLFLVEVSRGVKSTTIFADTINFLASIITPAANFIANALTILTDAFKALWSDDGGGMDGFTGRISERFAGLGKVIDLLHRALSKLVDTFSTMFPIFGKLATIVGNALGQFGDIILKTLNDGNFKAIFDMINGTLFAGILIGLNKYIYSITNIATKGGFLQNITGVFNGVRASLRLWQQELQAKIIRSIAASIAILALALVAISLIDSEKLTSSLAAIGGLLVQLFAGMVLLGKISGGPGIIGTFKIIAAMQGLGIAILILAVAMTKIAKLSWEEIAKGLSAIAALCIILVATSAGLSKASAKMVSGSVGLILFAVALNMLADSVIKLGAIDMGSLAKGLGSVGILIVELAIFMKLTSGAGMGIGKSLGLIALAQAIIMLAAAVTAFAALSVNELIKGLGAVGIVLLQLAIFTKLTGSAKNVIATALGLIILGQAMLIFANAIGIMGNLSWEQIQKGLLTMAGALTAVTIAVRLMPKGMIFTGTGLVLIAGALVVLAGALQTMGGMTWDEIVRGLTVLAGALTIIAIAMKFMTTSLVGAAALLVISAALTVLADVMITLGAMSLEQIGKSLLALAGVFAVLGLAALILTPLVPVLLALGAAVLLLGVGCLAVGAGITLFSVAITALSVALAAGGGAIVLFITSLLGLIPMALAQLGVGLIAFAKVIATAGPAFTEAIVTVLMAILDAIIKLTPKIVETFFALLTAILGAIVKAMPMIVSAIIDVVFAILKAIVDHIGELVTAGANIIIAILDGIASKLPDIVDSAFKLVISFINGLADAIRSNSAAISSAVGNLTDAIIGAVGDTVGKFIEAGGNVIAGFITGMKGKISDAANWAASMGSTVLQAAKDALGIKSPSKAFEEVGAMVGAGMTNGLKSGTHDAVKAGDDMSKAVYDNATDARIKAEHETYRSQNDVFASQKDMAKKEKDLGKAAAKEKKDLAKEAFDHAIKLIDDQKYYNTLSLQEELVAWQTMQKKYLDGSAEREKVDREVYRVKKELIAEEFNAMVKSMDDRKYYHKLSVADELATWEGAQKKYSEGTDERSKADREVYRIQQELGKSGFDQAVKWIDDHKYYNELGISEELAAWERIQKTYLEGTAEREKADKEVYRLKKEINALNESYSQKSLDLETSANEKRKGLEDDYYAKVKETNAKLKTNIASVNKEYEDALASRTQALYTAYGLFDTVTSKKPVSGQSLIKNLQDQAADLNALKQSLTGLSQKGVADGLLDELKTMGPSASAEIAALNTLSEPELATYVSLWQAKHNEAKSQAMDELEDMRSQTLSKISKLKKEASNELSGYRTMWNTQMVTLNADTVLQLDALNAEWALKLGTLRTAAETEFTTMSTNVSTTVSTLKANVETELTTLATNIQTIMATPDWAGVGINIIAGMINGIKAKAEELAEEVARTALRALNAAKRALGIKSPSKAFEEVGMYSIQGMVNGLQKFSGLVVDEASNVGTSAVDSLRNAMSRISDVVSGTIDMTPTIRPVIDLTDVVSGVKSIGSLLDGQGIRVTSATNKAASIVQNNQNGSVPVGNSMPATNGKSVSFTQNNYSPKALSRLDIYRQTKNQFSAVKGLVNA
jgi:tape measure domain-containing protein